MLKSIIALVKRYIIPRLPNKIRQLPIFGYKIGTPAPEFDGLPDDFVPLPQDGDLSICSFVT